MPATQRMRVGILHDPVDAGALRADEMAKLNPHGSIQVGATVQAVRDAIEELGWEPVFLPVGLDLPERARKAQVDVIFNMATGIADKKQQANVVAMLELLGIPFTGSGMRAHVLGLHKEVTKHLFRSMGIPTPKYQVFTTGSEEVDGELCFPLIVKPSSEGSSMGITRESVVRDRKQLLARVRYVLTTFQDAALVEEFIAGREFTIGVMGNEQPVPLPVEEIIFQNSFYSYDVKERDAVEVECPAHLAPDVTEAMLRAAVRAYRLLECAGYARFDVRMDSRGQFYFLEVNTLPGIQPGYSEIPRMAETAGMKFPDLVRRLVELGLERFEAGRAS